MRVAETTTGYMEVDPPFAGDGERWSRFEEEVGEKLSEYDVRLSPPERRWLLAYIWGGDAEASYRWAYGITESRGAGNRLSRTVRMRKALSAYYHAAGLTDEAIVGELCSVAFTRSGDVVDEEWEIKAPGEISGEHLSAVAGVENGKFGKKFKMHDKMRALELLAKIRGMLVDRSDVTFHGDLEARLCAARTRLSEDPGDG